MQRKNRQSGLELLRIIMMLQIIFLHFCDKGGYGIVVNQMHGIDRWIFYGAWYLSRCPVYIFFILTGYFLVKKEMGIKDIKDRIKKIYIPMIFFSILIPVVEVLFGMCSLSDVNIPKTFFPFLSKTWYFLTAYIVVIILSPFLNNMVKNLSKKQYKVLIGILVFVFCIWASLLSRIAPFNTFISTDLVILNQAGKSLYDYIFMYLLGGYLSLYTKKKNKLQFRYLFIYLLLGVLQCVLIRYFPSYKGPSGYNDNIFSVIQCICLVLFFRELKFKSRIINYISGYTLAIYIIHEHYLFRVYLWNNIFHVNKLSFYRGLYPIKIIGICVLIFIGCVIIEFMRRLLFKLVGMLINKIRKSNSKKTISNTSIEDNKNYIITILITSYNAKKYLVKCMDSVINQTCSKDLFEVIIVDDGSTDGSEKLCDEYAKMYDNVKVVHQENSGGPSTGRNKGIQLAKGKFIFFCDVDDYFGEDAVRRMITYACKWNPDVLLLKMAETNRSDVPTSMFDKDYENVTPYNSTILRTLGPWKLFRVEFLRNNDIEFPIDVLYEDLVFTIKAYFLAKKISIASDYDYYYWMIRDDGTNLTSNLTETSKNFLKIEKRMNGLKILCDDIHKYYDKKENLDELKFKMLNVTYDLFTFMIRNNIDEKYLDESYKMLKEYYDEEVLKNMPVNRYVILKEFFENRAKLSDLKLIHKDAVIDKCLPARRDNNKISIILPTDTDRSIDVTFAFENLLEFRLSNVKYDNNKMTLNFDLYSIKPVNKKNKLLIRAMEETDCSLEYDVTLKKSSLNKNGITDNYKDILPISNHYNCQVSFDIDSIAEKSLQLKNMYNDQVTWELLCDVNGSYNKIKLIDDKKAKDSFYSKAFLINDNIYCPDVQKKGYICIRQIGNKCDVKKCGYITYKNRPLTSRLIFSALINCDFEVVKSIVRDIQGNSLKLCNTDKKYIKYKYNGKRVYIYNNLEKKEK